jgi:hypothetical protein
MLKVEKTFSPVLMKTRRVHDAQQLCDESEHKGSFVMGEICVSFCFHDDSFIVLREEPCKRRGWQ